MSPQGLFEIAAKTYRSRASVAASVDFDFDDSSGAEEESSWQTSDDGDALLSPPTVLKAQLRHGALLDWMPSLQSSMHALVSHRHRQLFPRSLGGIPVR